MGWRIDVKLGAEDWKPLEIEGEPVVGSMDYCCGFVCAAEQFIPDSPWCGIEVKTVRNEEAQPTSAWAPLQAVVDHAFGCNAVATTHKGNIASKPYIEFTVGRSEYNLVSISGGRFELTNQGGFISLGHGPGIVSTLRYRAQKELDDNKLAIGVLTQLLQEKS